MSIKLQKFDLTRIPSGSAICFLGARRTGKTTCIRELLYTKRDYPAGIVLAPTDRMTESYSAFVPSVFIYYEFKTDIINKLFIRQQLIADENVERKKHNKKPIDTRAFLVMDDCLASKGEWAKDPTIMDLFFNGRHRHILFLLSMQFPLGIKPELRGNLDFVFIMAEDNCSNQKRLYDHYAGCFPSFDLFRKVLVETTRNFGCLVIDYRTKDPDITKKCFWYKAADPGKFTVGISRTIRFANRRFDPNWGRRRKPFDIQEYIRKKNKVNVDVELQDKEE